MTTKSALLTTFFFLSLTPVASAQVGFGGGPAAGAKKPTLNEDLFSHWAPQLDRTNALLTGEITKITKIKVISKKKQNGSRGGRASTWTETKTSYSLEFQPEETIRGKVKKGTLKALLIVTEFDDIPPAKANPFGDYKVGNKGLLLLSGTKKRWKVDNFVPGNTYALARARGDDPKTAYKAKQRLLWVGARIQFFDSLFRARKILAAVASIRKKSRGKKAFKMFDNANSLLTSAIAKLRDQGFPADYIALFEAEQAKLNQQAKSQKDRLKL